VCPPNEWKQVNPSFAFLLRHPTTNTRFLFGLDIRKDYKSLAPAALNRMHNFEPLSVPQDIKEGLKKGGLEPDDIEYICLSYIHWDNIGDTSIFRTS
jgi:hypothetical protein